MYSQQKILCSSGLVKEFDNETDALKTNKIVIKLQNSY